MKESPFGFSYSWDDLQPIRPLAVTVVVVQLIGAIAGLAVRQFPGWFENLWLGGAIGTLPGFVLGLAIQAHMDPGAIGENQIMVRRFGLVALLMTAIGATMPWWWHAL